MFEVASPSAHHVRTLAITLATLTPVVAKDPMRKHTRHLKFCIEDMVRPRNSSDLRVSRLPYVTFQLLTIQVDKRQFCYYNHVSTLEQCRISHTRSASRDLHTLGASTCTLKMC